MKNMIEDVCELGSILQSGDEEKIALERKLVELDGAIQAQDRRLNHEVEAEDWARSEQIKILEHAENASDSFELCSSVVSHLQEESISSRHLQNILLRVEDYLNLKDGLVSSMEHTQMQIKYLQKAFNKLEDTKAEEIPKKIECTHDLIKENEILEEKLENSLTESQSYTAIRSNDIEENLLLSASTISSTFPQIEQSQRLIEDKTGDLVSKAAVERSDADLTLSSLQSAKQVSLSHLIEVVHERDDLLGQFKGLEDGILKDQSLLHISQDENKVLLNNSTCSSKAKYTTAREVDDAKKELIEHEKESSDNRDELDRIKKALSFERLREEAFVKSQNGNSGSAQQICLETDNLRASLQIVRDEIALIKKQIEPQPSGAIIPWVQLPELTNEGPHEELEYLTATYQYHQDQRDRISADVTACTHERDVLNEEFRVAETHGAVAGEEKANLEGLKKALLVEQKELVQRIQEIQADLPYTDATLSSTDSVPPEITSHLVRDLEEVEASRISAVEDSTILIAYTASHAERVEAFNIQKESKYVLLDKNQRLKISRQEKLIDTERMLKDLQMKLTREDGKFQEAVKLADVKAKKKEEELLAIMNKVSSAGLKLTADRENATREAKELEDSLIRMDKEHVEQLHIITTSSVDSTEAFQIRPHLKYAQNQASAPLPKEVAPKRILRSNSKGDLTKEDLFSPPTPHYGNWGESSPATNLPGHDDTAASQPTATGGMSQSKRVMQSQQQDGSKKASQARKKSLGAPVDREKGAKANTGNERHRRSH
mmetsp:Transcript_24062/g.23128  ORF Transcript_24062/g.23128 Transcript_24062/m.23128 type:complete len:777 (+) Transcript_24062:70-2400(+)